MIVLTTLNARYTHTNLALRYLQAAARAAGFDAVIKEFSINDDPGLILRQLYEMKPGLLGFSCYIWNIDKILPIMESLKQLQPELRIIAGGPEVSYDAVELLKKCPFIDAVIKGEGEYAFVDYIKQYFNNGRYDGIRGLVWRKGQEVIDNGGMGLVPNLDELPNPYTDLDGLDGRMAYFETSRGCPFNCAYCLSSTTRGVRYVSMERVKQGLASLATAQPAVIKFVDRTFNVRNDRAREIMEYAINLPGNSTYHFEIVGEGLDEEFLEFLSRVPEGKVQLEIGVQSTCPSALEAVNRRQDLKKLDRVLQALKKMDNIHVHLDIIAGLPCEDYSTFRHTFNRVYKWEPDYLQLGFLKLLKGSPLREKANEYGYVYQNNPPYEVLSNRWLSFADISRLKRIEDLVQRYYNSGVFRYTLKTMVEKGWGGDAFSFYESFADYWKVKGWAERAWARPRLYEFLADFIKTMRPEVGEIGQSLLIFDFIIYNPNNEVPAGIRSEPERAYRKNVSEFLKNMNEKAEKAALTAGRIAEGIRAHPRIHVFKNDILFLAGLNNPIRRNIYPVLFQWVKGRCKVQYVDGQ